MSRKPDTASALAGILSARRGITLGEPKTTASPAETQAPPSPAPPTPPPSVSYPIANRAPSRRTGKCSDKENYRQISVYVRKDTRKKVGRALDDADSKQDFSELVQELLEKWLASRT